VNGSKRKPERGALADWPTHVGAISFVAKRSRDSGRLKRKSDRPGEAAPVTGG
jgi:hypothetical protein